MFNVLTGIVLTYDKNVVPLHPVILKRKKMDNIYFKGVLAAYIGTGFMSHQILEWQIDMIKESISHFCEAQIDQSPLSHQDKKKQKCQMKQNLEVYIHGVKDANSLAK